MPRRERWAASRATSCKHVQTRPGRSLLPPLGRRAMRPQCRESCCTNLGIGARNPLRCPLRSCVPSGLSRWLLHCARTSVASCGNPPINPCRPGWAAAAGSTVGPDEPLCRRTVGRFLTHTYGPDRYLVTPLEGRRVLALQASGLVEAVVTKSFDATVIADCIRAVTQGPIRPQRVA